MLSEAEELLVRAWTSEDVRHKGRFWNASFPILRPRPYQVPHPPLVRACITEESLIEMARIGRPALMNVQTLDTLRHRLQRYRETMLEAGYERDRGGEGPGRDLGDPDAVRDRERRRGRGDGNPRPEALP